MQTVNITALVKSPRSLWFLFAFLLTSLICETAKGVAPIAPTRTVELHVSGNDLVQVLQSDTDPVITLNGSATVTLTEGASYSDPGATCNDAEDGAISIGALSYSPTLNLNAAGTYVGTATCTDSDGNTVTATRTVYVNSAGGGGALAFSNVTTSVMPTLEAGQDPVVAPFYGRFGHIDNDGCLDIFITTHTADEPDGIYMQENVGGVCQGTYDYLPNTYRAANGVNGYRFTGAVMMLDLDANGFVDIFGTDADSDPSLVALQTSDEVFSPATGCIYNVDRCTPIDYNGDGSIEMVGGPLVGTTFSDNVLNTPTGSAIYGEIYAWPSGTNIWTPDWANINEPNLTRAWSTVLAFDANNDSYPDLVYPQLDLVFFGSAGGYPDTGSTGHFTVPAAVTSTVYNTDADEHSNSKHQIPIDFDNDGDLDIFRIRVQKGGNNSFDASDADADGDGYFLLENDGNGNFTDVASTEMAGLSPTSLTYTTTYSGVGIGDFNNDGLTDIRAEMTDGSFTNSCVVWMNGGTGNWSIESFPCGYVLDSDGTKIPGAGGSSKTSMGHGDYDNDGLLDLAMSNHQPNASYDTAAVWRNTTSGAGNYLKFFVRGAPTDFGLHTRITMYAANTSTILCSREMQVYEQSGTKEEHCGLGNTTLVDINVRYPNGGANVTIEDVPVNRTVALYPTGNYSTYTHGQPLPSNTYTPPAAAVNTTVTLVADSAVTPTATEQVTFAVPFPEGDVLNTDEIKVSIGGSEVAVAVEEIVSYHGGKTGIRSARIQIPSVDMTGGDVTVTIDDTGSSVSRVSFASQSGEFATASATKASMPFKRIWAKHNLAYVAGTGLIPPYATGADLDSAYATYAEHQFDNWAEPFDYSASSQANWLFDRAGAIYKKYLQFGDTKYLKEAFLAFRYYISNIQLTGTVASGRGGWIGDTVDDKYAYSEAILIHYALTGDDTWLPGGDTVNAVVTDMALRALDYSEQGSIYTSLFSNGDGYESEREFFTERRTGLTLWGAAVACSITGDATLCGRVDDFILDLKDHQQVADSFDTANGWDAKTGAFVHSWLAHECGGCFAGNESNIPLGSDADRRFSPWMSSNIQLALWTMYWTLDDTLLSNRSELPEIIRFFAEGVHNYGLDPSPIGASSVSHGFAAYTQSRAGYEYGSMSFCDATDSSPFILYTSAPYATQAELFDPIPYTGGGAGVVAYPDNRASTHYGEVMSLLAAGLYFETDPTKRAQLETTIANLSDVYTIACSTWFPSQGVPRAYNWQFFTNPRATYDWVKEQ